MAPKVCCPSADGGDAINKRAAAIKKRKMAQRVRRGQQGTAEVMARYSRSRGGCPYSRGGSRASRSVPPNLDEFSFRREAVKRRLGWPFARFLTRHAGHRLGAREGAKAISCEHGEAAPREPR